MTLSNKLGISRDQTVRPLHWNELWAVVPRNLGISFLCVLALNIKSLFGNKEKNISDSDEDEK